MIKRIRHLIEVAKHVIIIYIDHATNLAIVRQIKLTSSSVDKLNIKLIRVFVYLSQFKLNIRYKLSKFYIILDALSRLFITNRIFIDKDNVLNIENFHDNIINSKDNYIYAYNYKFIVIFLNFKKKLQKNYRIDKIWVKIFAILKIFNVRLAKEK